MCGRFALLAEKRAMEEFFALMSSGDDFPPRYNIAPTQPIIVVIASEGQKPGRNMPDRKAVLVRWGFIPGWVKDPREFPLLINARAETAAEKASFRAAMRHRRILIPASGFYEWHRPSKESGAKSQAYWIRPRDTNIVAFAGLMETWSSADGSEVDTAAILTTQANAAMAPIHDRMPVVIRQDDFRRWLDCKTQEPRDVADLLKPVQDDVFEAVPVSDMVNKVGNTGPEIQEPVTVTERPAARATRKNPPDDDGQMTLF